MKRGQPARVSAELQLMARECPVEIGIDLVEAGVVLLFARQLRVDIEGF
jgi:hypothetical protein